MRFLFIFKTTNDASIKIIFNEDMYVYKYKNPVCKYLYVLLYFIIQ